jgi:hypothetical protein
MQAPPDIVEEYYVPDPLDPEQGGVRPTLGELTSDWIDGFLAEALDLWLFNRNATIALVIVAFAAGTLL